MRRGFGDALISLGAIAVLLATLVAIDDRVREQVALRLSGGGQASTDLAYAGAQMRNLAAVMMDAVRDQSIEHAPLVIFVLVASVLVLFMLRT